jgi:predicted esterase
MTETVRGLFACRAPIPYRLDLPPVPPPAGGHPFLLALHGRGESGDLLAAKLGFDDSVPYARLYPSGPIPVACRAGEEHRGARSWYRFDGDQDAFLRALAEGEALLKELVPFAASRHGLDPLRVVLLGYSQGGYLASFAALRNRRRFRGLVAVSCRVKHEALAAELADAAGYPVLGIHGEHDPVVKPGPQREAFAVLASHGLDAELHLVPGRHRLVVSAVPLIDGFVRRVLGV